MAHIDVTALRDEAARLLKFETSLMREMLKLPGVITERVDGVEQTYDVGSANKEIEVLTGELAKLGQLETVVAIVGTMKAGKSTTINAIVGSEVLPNRNRPMTAIPTLIRHSPGQTEPRLEFRNTQPVNELLGRLRAPAAQKAARENIARLDSEAEAHELMTMLEEKEQFEQEYIGPAAIFSCLRKLNDLARLAVVLEVDFPFAAYDEVHEFPCIHVEFSHLRGYPAGAGQLTLLDTPGPNEAGQLQLRGMLREQLAKASAVIAVLDYTQLKSDADAEVREEISRVAEMASGRVHVLVNKFDQKDRNSDDARAVSNYVCRTLLRGRVAETDVYPVSSRLAFLANSARRAIAVSSCLPTNDEAPWVADVGTALFGNRWEKRMGDVEAVREGAEDLWEDSMFQRPLDRVIGAAYERSAVLAVESAAAKVEATAKKLHGLLAVRDGALRHSAEEINRQVAAIRRDLKRVLEAEGEARKRLDAMLRKASGIRAARLEEVAGQTMQDLHRFFGKALAKDSEAQGGKGREAKRKSLLPRRRRHGARLFDAETRVIERETRAEAEAFMRDVAVCLEEHAKDAQLAVHDAVAGVMKEFASDFAAETGSILAAVAEGLNGRLVDLDVSVQVELPPMDGLTLDIATKEIFSGAIRPVTRSQKYVRRSTGVWGTVCSWFNTDDWGWEEVTQTKKVFELNVDKIAEEAEQAILGALKVLDEASSELVATALSSSLDEFFDDFRGRIARIRGDMEQSLRDHGSSEKEQQRLKDELQKLSRRVPLKDAKHLLQALAKAVAQQESEPRTARRIAEPAC